MQSVQEAAQSADGGVGSSLDVGHERTQHHHEPKRRVISIVFLP